jgi:hypothetical protein
MYESQEYIGGKTMSLKKRFALITRVTVMILAALALISIHERLTPPAAASTSGNQHKGKTSTTGTATSAVYDDGGVKIGTDSLSQLTAQFWRWLYSIPVGVDPGSDTIGVNCGINQQGDEWFLAGPASGDTTATCAIPDGKTIVAAVYASLDDYPCPASFNFEPPAGQSLADFLQQDDLQFVNGENATAQLDGKPLKVKRIKSGLFSFTAAANRVLFDPCATGSPQVGVSDGFFVFIDPLPHGDHVLLLSWSGTQAFGTRMVNLRIR